MDENLKEETSENPNITEETSVDLIETAMHFEAEMEIIEKGLAEARKILVGQDELMRKMFIALLCEGHILLEGVPGIAKTLSARVMSKIIKADFSRIQFTPDLMPSDILGTSIFDASKNDFVFKKGPIFSNVILIDEINRAPAKSQAALFEVMEEQQISFDGETYLLNDPFIVIATQNPIEQEGTYRLPEAQLDRFLFRIILDYPDFGDEVQILNRFSEDVRNYGLDKIKANFTKKTIVALKKASGSVHIENQIKEYIVSLVHATRNNSKIFLGASPRASLAIMRASRVFALMNGRNFVIPDDIQYVTPMVLNHRIILTPEAEISGLSPFKVVDELISQVEVPR